MHRFKQRISWFTGRCDGNGNGNGNGNDDGDGEDRLIGLPQNKT
jgi:hypothetical protein